MRFRLALALIVLAGLYAEAPAQGLWYWCETTRAYSPYVTTCSVPWRPVAPRPYAPMTQPAPGVWPTPPSSPPPSIPVAEPTDAYRQGVADWQSQQAWFDSQTGDRHAGAEFWNGSRNKAGHKSCAEAGSTFSGNKTDFIAGCQDAKQRLDPIDLRRDRDPQYHDGWNDGKEQPPLPASTAPSAVSASPATAVGSFSAYPASGSVYAGRHVPPDLSAPDNYLFRTRITAASQESPNFARRYVISIWGCGTGCGQGVAVNVATGKVIWLPGSFFLEPFDGDRFEYRLDSRLLIVNGHESDGDETPYAPRCYVLSDEASAGLVKTSCGTPASVPASPGVSTTISPPDNTTPQPAASAPSPLAEATHPTPVAATPSSTQPSSEGAGFGGVILLVILAALAGYFLPTIVAAARHHHNAGAIFVLNLFLGWTFLGWVLALVWSATAVRPPARQSG
jgi:hypothetical protein